MRCLQSSHVSPQIVILKLFLMNCIEAKNKTTANNKTTTTNKTNQNQRTCLATVLSAWQNQTHGKQLLSGKNVLKGELFSS